MGANAQGKTNLLEALYLLATLRSFRGVGGAQLIRHEAKGYFIGATVTSDLAHEIKIYWSRRERKLTLDERPIRRLADYLGTLRAVVFCTEDLQLIKGSSRVRRRFVDLMLSQTIPGYLESLLRYTQALRSRNALLKQRTTDEMLLSGFTKELVENGNRLIEARRILIPRLSPLVRLAFRRISHDVDELRMSYRPNIQNDFAVELAQSRIKEASYRMTLMGPHRDDLELQVNDQLASQFASEGQKRSLALALKIAQAEYLAGIHGSSPVLLIDDVMGELDSRRRSGFLPLLDQAKRTGGQVFMTCTEENWPRELGVEFQRWSVENGRGSSTGARIYPSAEIAPGRLSSTPIFNFSVDFLKARCNFEIIAKHFISFFVTNL